MKYILNPITVLFIFFTNWLCALDTSRLDSLSKALKKTESDTVKINLLNEIAWEYQRYDILKAKRFSQLAMQLSEKKGYMHGKANALSNMGCILADEGFYDEAVQNYLAAINIRKNIAPESIIIARLYNNIGIVYANQANYPMALYYMKLSLELKLKQKDKTDIASQHYNIGILYYYQGDFGKAQNHYFEALKVFESLADSNKTAECLNAVGALYNVQKNYDKAKKYYLKSLDIFKKTGNKVQLSTCYDNIGEVHLVLGNTDEAEKNFLKALELREAAGYKKGIADCLNELGDVYRARMKFQPAVDYKLKALAMFEEAGNKVEEADCLGDIGHVYLEMKQYIQAIAYFEKSITVAEKASAKSVLYNSYSGITSALENTGRFKEALSFQKKYNAISDSIFNENIHKKTSELEMIYQTGKTEQENVILAKENQLQLLTIEKEKDKRRNQLIVMAGVVVFIIFASLFFYTRYRYHYLSQMEEEKRKQEQARFRMIIDAQEKERARIAAELHDGLGNLLSTAKLNIAGLEDSAKGEEKKLFDNSINLIDEACNEIRAISHNLMPASLMRQGLIPAVKNLIKKINDSQQVKVELTESLNEYRTDKPVEIALYRIVQEVLNNMLIHSHAKFIFINFEMQQGKILFSANDNGMGFDTSIIQNQEGIGWKNILSRVSLLNGNFEINSKIESGTSVKIEIPV